MRSLLPFWQIGPKSSGPRAQEPRLWRCAGLAVAADLANIPRLPAAVIVPLAGAGVKREKGPAERLNAVLW
jgi:hypothetical protein